MSEVQPIRCKNCNEPLAPGQRFCANCGASVETPQPYTLPASVSPPPPPSYEVPPTPSSPSLPPYNTPPPPPPMNSAEFYSSPNFPNYGVQQPVKKRSPLPFIIIGVVAVILLACGGTVFATLNALRSPSSSTPSSTKSGSGNGGNTTTNTASKQDIKLTVPYSGVEMTFTSLEQAPKFDDDTYTTYKSKPNYVRVNFTEKAPDDLGYTFYSYRSAFHLILPDGTSLSPAGYKEYSGPDAGEERSNWLDFGTSALADLNNLRIRIGASDEEKVEVALKTDSDVSAYQPKTVTNSTTFKYAQMNMTIKSYTRTLSYGGKQAKTGQVFVVVDMEIDNTSDTTYYLYGNDFLRLQTGTTVKAAEYSSKMNDFYTIKAGATDVQGTTFFIIPKSDSYTLKFLGHKSKYSGDESWNEVSQELKFG